MQVRACVGAVQRWADKRGGISKSDRLLADTAVDYFLDETEWPEGTARAPASRFRF